MRSLAIAGAAAVLVSQAALAKDSLIMGMVLEPPHLDPTAGAAAAIDEVVYANIFEGLTRIDEQGLVQPALAQDWQISEDGLTYTFSLQDGVTFHDGSAFDAEDVVFSIERILAEDSTNAQKGLYEVIDSVEAIDPHTVQLGLSRPDGQLLFSLGWGDAVMVAPESAETNKNAPVGTGPFRFERWVKGDSVTITRRDDYWGEAPALASATFKFIPDPAAAMTALLAGDVDAFANFPAPENLAQFEGDPRFTVVIGTTEGETILAMNNERIPFDDLNVRRAFAHAIDRQAVIDGAMFGYGTPIGTHFAPHHPAYVDLTGRYPYDPDLARTLLQDAGIDDLKVTLKLPPPSYARRGGEIIAAQLKQVGIEAEIIPMEWAQWLEQVFRGRDFDLTIVSHTEPMDINIYGRPNYYFAYRSNAFGQLMDELDNATSEAQRMAVLRAAQELIAEDAVNVFLFQLAKHGVWKKDIQGLWANSPVQANDLTEVSWAE
ncbi:MAG: ABC transporter substrate-binding protein [Geminicoccaceae bacterium]